VKSSGLEEAWTESNLLGVKTAEKVFVGNSYAKGMRTHKIFFFVIFTTALY